MAFNTTEETVRDFTFGAVDCVVFVIMLTTSAGVGVYFGFFSKAKNTDDYLMGGRKMKTIPIAISLVASQLSGIAIMSVPAENYSFGFNYFFMVISMILVVPVLTHIVAPVFYENKISNCYEYLQLRFNKRTRQIVTASFILNAFLMLPVYVFVPALAFAQVTGINIHLINAVVCSICVFYTMLGGIKAVVWTDVIQAGIMLSSVVLVGILGTVKSGGLSQVLEYAYEGGRLDVNYSLDPRVRITLWNALTGGFIMWTGHIGLNQSCVQRIVSLPTIKKAQKSLIMAGVGITIIMGFNCYIGIVMFARYYDCDPIKAGIVDKADKMVPFFVQDVMGHLKGMPGVFQSCVFSAALSTMSAVLNSLAGVVYFDYIKPFIKHTDARANTAMRIFIIVTGVYSILGGLIVQRFNSIMQLIITITGISTGSVVGIFLLGMFVPRVNGKVAIASIIFSATVMFIIIGNGQMHFKSGVIKYDPLPTSIDQCDARNFHYLIQSLKNTSVSLADPNHKPPLMTTAFGSNRDFSIFEISFYWYKLIGAFLVWVLAIPLSYIWQRGEDEKLDLKLFTPIIRKYIKQHLVPLEEVPLKLPQTDTNLTILMTEKPEKESTDPNQLKG